MARGAVAVFALALVAIAMANTSPEFEAVIELGASNTPSVGSELTTVMKDATKESQGVAMAADGKPLQLVKHRPVADVDLFLMSTSMVINISFNIKSFIFSSQPDID